MKRNGGIFTFLTLALSSLVSAQSGPIEGLERLADGAREMITITIQFISNVLFDLESFDEFFFAKIILLLLIFFITYTVLKRNDIFGRDKKIAIIISAAISILAIRYLPTEFVEVILLQYSAFAVGITTLLPLMIFFFFLHQSGFGHRGRQIGWILYGLALIGMTGFRYQDLGSASYVYYAGIFAVAISIIGDRFIHTQFSQTERRAMKKSGDIQRYIELEKKIKVMKEDMTLLNFQGKERKTAERVLRDMEERAKELHKDLG